MITLFKSIIVILILLVFSIVPTWGVDQNKDLISSTTYGELADGFRAEIEVKSLPSDGRTAQLIVWLNHVDYTNQSLPGNNFFDRLRKGDWEYYMPTNSFCGPIELRNSGGQKMPLIKQDYSVVKSYHGREVPLNPDVSSLTAYPNTFNERVEHDRYFNQFKTGYLGSGIFPLPLFISSTRTEIVRFLICDISKNKSPSLVPTLYQRIFKLNDYFEVNSPGEYTLTVWPKYYRRLIATSQECERVDLPPVSVKIKWE